MTVEITETLIAGLRPPTTGRIEVLDSRAAGLALRITAADIKSWAVRGRLPTGKRVRVTLGKYPQLGIREARRKAREALGDISKGTDRTAAKRAERDAEAAAAAAPTVAMRLDQWRARKESDWSARYAAEVERLADKIIIPELGSKVLTQTTRAHWVELVAGLRRSAPGTASWLYSTVSSFLNYSEAMGWLPGNPLPRRGRNVIAPHVAPRERVLSDDELARVWCATEQLSPKTRCFCRLLILCACRVSEAANIAAGEVNQLTGHWTLPSERSKNGIAHVMPLHPLLLKELAAIWPDECIKSDHRLLGSVKGSGFTAPAKLKVKVDRLSGVTAWRWHDLRRSARSTMARLGVPDRHAEAALAHIADQNALQRTYNRHPYRQEAIAALAAWQAHVTDILRRHQERALDLVSA